MNQIDETHIQRAANRLALNWPIHIRYMTDAEIVNHPDRLGARLPSPNGEHRIVIRDGRDATATAQTLCHELAHCAQAEALQDKLGAYQQKHTAELERQARELTHTLGVGLAPVRPMQ